MPPTPVIPPVPAGLDPAAWSPSPTRLAGQASPAGPTGCSWLPALAFPPASWLAGDGLMVTAQPEFLSRSTVSSAKVNAAPLSQVQCWQVLGMNNRDRRDTVTADV